MISITTGPRISPLIEGWKIVSDSAEAMSKVDELDEKQRPYKFARFRVLGGEVPSPSLGSMSAKPVVPVPEIGEYTRPDWDAESYALFAEGGDPGGCPDCGRTGFYGPRFVEPDLRCRACRFCGFWQFVEERAVRFLPTGHGCAQWPEVSKAPYIWWVPPDSDSYDCPFCEHLVEVPLSLLIVPFEDSEHPWWKIPQRRTQSFYQRLWGNWEASAGRIIL